MRIDVGPFAVNGAACKLGDQGRGSPGAGEGKLDIIAWAGYAEDGSTDPKVDWVTPFEQKTGCKTNVKIGNTSDEMVQLMRTGQYDGVSASGEAGCDFAARDLFRNGLICLATLSHSARSSSLSARLRRGVANSGIEVDERFIGRRGTGSDGGALRGPV